MSISSTVSGRDAPCSGGDDDCPRSLHRDTSMSSRSSTEEAFSGVFCKEKERRKDKGKIHCKSAIIVDKILPARSKSPLFLVHDLCWAIHCLFKQGIKTESEMEQGMQEKWDTPPRLNLQQKHQQVEISQPAQSAVTSLPPKMTSWWVLSFCIDKSNVQRMRRYQSQ